MCRLSSWGWAGDATAGRPESRWQERGLRPAWPGVQTPLRFREGASQPHGHQDPGCLCGDRGWLKFRNPSFSGSPFSAHLAQARRPFGAPVHMPLAPQGGPCSGHTRPPSPGAEPSWRLLDGCGLGGSLGPGTPFLTKAHWAPTSHPHSGQPLLPGQVQDVLQGARLPALQSEHSTRSHLPWWDGPQHLPPEAGVLAGPRQGAALTPSLALP